MFYSYFQQILSRLPPLKLRERFLLDTNVLRWFLRQNQFTGHHSIPPRCTTPILDIVYSSAQRATGLHLLAEDLRSGKVIRPIRDQMLRATE
eukprot:4464819-Amphidinium_carterae.2